MMVSGTAFRFSLFLGIAAAFSPLSAQSSDERVDNLDFLGKVSQAVYSNNYFGFRVNVPNGWLLVDDEDRRKSEQLVSELLRQKNETDGTNYTPPKFNTITLLHLKKKRLGEAENALFRIAVTKQANSRITSQMVARLSRDKVIENPFAQTVSEAKEVTINGTEFVTFDYLVNANPKTPRKGIYYSTVKREYSIAFILSVLTDEDEKQLQKMIQSIYFK